MIGGSLCNWISHHGMMRKHKNLNVVSRSSNFDRCISQTAV